MKSVTMSQVVRAQEARSLLWPIQSWSQLLSLGVMLAIGLPVIVMVLRLLDPTAPLAYIVIPALAGASIPLFAALPGRFEVMTRFHARHFVHTLDEAIVSMGYSRGESTREGVCYSSSHPGLLRWKENQIALTVNEHAIGVEGPVFALRALQRKLTG